MNLSRMLTISIDVGWLLGIAILAGIIWFLVRMVLHMMDTTPGVPEELDDSTVIPQESQTATIIAKRTEQKGRETRYMVDFQLEGGVPLSLEVPEDHYGEMEEGQKNCLTLEQGFYVDFDDGPAFRTELDPFSEEDFDPNLDHPLRDTYEPTGLFGIGERREPTPEEQELEQHMRDYGLLPSLDLTGEDATDNLPWYPAHKLMQLCGLPPFLRLLPQLQEIFADAFRLACQRILLDDGQRPKGIKSQRVALYENDFQVTVTVVKTKEEPPFHIAARFVVNGELED